jgi:hypothetical protein
MVSFFLLFFHIRQACVRRFIVDRERPVPGHLRPVSPSPRIGRFGFNPLEQPHNPTEIARRRRTACPFFAAPRLRKNVPRPARSARTELIPLDKSALLALAKTSFKLAKNHIYQCDRPQQSEVWGWWTVASSCISRLNAGEQNETTPHPRRTLIRLPTVPVPAIRSGPRRHDQPIHPRSHRNAHLRDRYPLPLRRPL